MKANGKGQRIELGQFIVADQKICHGKPTYKGTRIMVWQILEALADGESVDELVEAWGGRVSREAILETIRLAGTKSNAPKQSRSRRKEALIFSPEQRSSRPALHGEFVLHWFRQD